jgi:hypothetical protein
MIGISLGEIGYTVVVERVTERVVGQPRVRSRY